MSEWKLTDGELLDFRRLLNHVSYVSDMRPIVFDRVIKSYQEWLAAQCGPDPCVGCDPFYKNICQDDKYEGKPRHDCPDYRDYKGQQAGYAKGLAECEARIHKREQEIVEWVESKKTETPPEDVYYANEEYYHGRSDVLSEALEWLKGEGK